MLYIVNSLIYPVPDINLPFLGVHLTKMVNGSIEAGPNAVFSFKKEGYSRLSFSFFDNRKIFASLQNDEILLNQENYKYSNVVEIRLKQSSLENILNRCKRASLNDTTFSELVNLSSNMLVPESEISRERGAGAGNIDND